MSSAARRRAQARARGRARVGAMLLLAIAITGCSTRTTGHQGTPLPSTSPAVAASAAPDAPASSSAANASGPAQDSTPPATAEVLDSPLGPGVADSEPANPGVGQLADLHLRHPGRVEAVLRG